MARRLLTDRTLKALKPAPAGKRLDIIDTVVPGFGIRVTDKADSKGYAAQRTFILVARYPGSPNPTRRALGEYGKLTLDQARQKAREWHELISKGIDPGQRETEQRTSEAARRANTFGVVAEDFIKRHLKNQRRAQVSEREIRKELLGQTRDRKTKAWRNEKPQWRNRPIESITKRDVVQLIDEILDRGARRHAHNILGHARAIFNWAINRGTYGIEQSPCDRLKPSQLIGVKVPRQRVLNDAEVRAVWNASQRLPYPFGPLTALLMLTGCRQAEGAEARWKEFDLGKKVWTIPKERFKSDSPHIVPLSDAALAVLDTLPRFNSGDFLFSSTHGRKPVSGFSNGKERLDALIAKETAIEPWVFHDLRRTVRTRLSELRVPEPVAEMVIGHARKGLARVYDQHRYIDEMREALDAWSARLRDIVQPPPANIVKIAVRA
jgi:integrase